MKQSYVLNYTPDAALLGAAVRAKSAMPKVRGQRAVKLLHLLHCVLVVLGGISLGYLSSDLLTGRPTLLHWGAALGLALSYVAIFGSIFVTLPTLVRQSLATRANKWPVEMTVDTSGVTTRTEVFESRIKWAGIEGVTRSKQGFVLWVGGGRPSIPFAAFAGPEEIEAFAGDSAAWLEASR